MNRNTPTLSPAPTLKYLGNKSIILIPRLHWALLKNTINSQNRYILTQMCPCLFPLTQIIFSSQKVTVYNDSTLNVQVGSL